MLFQRLAAAPHIVWAVLFILAPMLFVLYFAFTDGNGNFTTDNITAMGQYSHTFILSIAFALIATVVCLLIGYPLAYFMSRTSPRTRKVLMVLIMKHSQRYFTDRAPQYLWMPMETLTARLLERDLRTEDALTCQMLFRQELRASLLRELDGVSGCWTGDAGGTHFFWGLDRRTVLFPLRLRESAGAAALAGQNSLGEAVTVPLTPQALTERLRDGSLLPGLFLCFLEAHFLRDFTVFGGFYQPTYLAEMRRGLVRALRETGGYEEEAAIIEAKRSAMTLGLIYLLRSRESGSFPVSTAELLEEPVSTPEVETSLQGSVAAALEHLN